EGLAELGRVEREPNAQHAGLLAPTRELLAQVRRIRVDAAHHGEALRMRARRGDGEVVAVALPGRRNDDGAVDPAFVHPAEHLFGAHRGRALRMGMAARPPRPPGRVRAPDVDLRIDDDQRYSRYPGSMRSSLRRSAGHSITPYGRRVCGW